MYKQIVLFVVLMSFFSYCVNAGNPSLLVNQNNDLCNFLFNITTNNVTFTSTIYYTFQTNTTNFTIEYWIEDEDNLTIKEKRNTTNLNKKQFTPDSGNYTIKANLYKDSCILYQELKISKQLELPVNQSRQNSSKYSLDIEIKENISQKTIYYKIKTNATNFTITYWLEDYLGNIVKQPINTTNTNQKQYTPSSLTNLFYIKAKLIVHNYTVIKSKLATFYSKSTYEVKECPKCSKTVSRDLDETKESKSNIEIINKEDIQSGKKTELIYEIYRGKTQKRVIYIYLNNKKISSAELEKHSKLKGRVLLFPEKGLNNLTITGLDLQEEMIFYNNKTANIIQKSTNSKSQANFQITNLTLNNAQINFFIDTNIASIRALCYISYIRTPISSVLNLSNVSNESEIKLTVNNTKLLKKVELKKYPLKLYCKYKKENNKHYTYDSIAFNYTLNSQIQTLNISQVTSEYKPNPLTKPILIQELNLNPQKTEEIIYSDNYQTKQNSFFFVFLATTIILSILILKW